MGLGTARVLNELKDSFAGTVLIAFQPAEEIGAGAKQFVASGKLTISMNHLRFTSIQDYLSDRLRLKVDR